VLDDDSELEELRPRFWSEKRANPEDPATCGAREEGQVITQVAWRAKDNSRNSPYIKDKGTLHDGPADAITMRPLKVLWKSVLCTNCGTVGCGARLNLGTVLVERGADPTLLVFRTAGWSKTSNRGRKLSQHLIFIDDDSANNAKEDAVVQSAAQDRTPSPNKKVIKGIMILG
jgi:hypothetical protein